MKAGGIYQRLFFGVLAISLILRLVIVVRGGQFFWGDEKRFLAGENAWKLWETGQGLQAGLRELLGGADHLGFKVLTLLPAWVQRHVGGGYLTSSALLSLLSFLNIIWVWLIARRLGAGPREAFWAALAMAGANSMFYWARHMMPYDAALCWALACLYVGVKPAAKFRDSVLAGVLGCIAFVSYNGYWSIVACVLVAHVLVAMPAWWDLTKRALGGLLGLVGSFVIMVVVVSHAMEVNLMDDYVSFSETIYQGDFREGALVFFDYLWRTEGGTALVWLLALLVSGWLINRADLPSRRRGAVWVGCIVALMAILIIGANVMEKFVVYGRLARQVAPFCALLVGWTAGQIFKGETRPGRFEWVTLTALVLCAAWSMATPIRQLYPVTFHRRSLAPLAEYRKQHPEIPADKFKYLYLGFIWPEADRTVPPPHEVLLESRHPLAWRPYLYEGFSRVQRDQIEGTDIRMRLILVKD